MGCIRKAHCEYTRNREGWQEKWHRAAGAVALGNEEDSDIHIMLWRLRLEGHNGLKINQLKEVLGHRRMETMYKDVHLDRTNLRAEMEQGAL